MKKGIVKQRPIAHTNRKCERILAKRSCMFDGKSVSH